MIAKQALNDSWTWDLRNELVMRYAENEVMILESSLVL